MKIILLLLSLLLIKNINSYQTIHKYNRRKVRLYQTFQEYLNSNNKNTAPPPPSPTTTTKVISDNDFEDLLMSGDDAKPNNIESTTINKTVEEKKGSGVQDLFTVATTILAKTKVSDLRVLINKYDSSQLPDIKEDVETHISIALDVTWNSKNGGNGDWSKLIEVLNEEVGEKAKIGDEYIKKAVLVGSQLTIDRIKDLIIKYKDKNAIPKINKEKYVGKLLKGDYLATLIDILREDNLNDYEKVFDIMILETTKGGAKVEKKKGFGNINKVN